MRQLALAQAICFGDGAPTPSRPKQIELPHRPPAPKTSLLIRAGGGGRRNCELFVLCRLRTPHCHFRVPVVLEKIQRRQALPWSRCPTEHGVRRRSNAAAGVFGLRRGGGRGRVGCAASYARIGRRGACEERAVKRRPVVALPGACDEGAVKGGAAYASAGGLADAGLACELVSRRRRGPAPGTRTGWAPRSSWRPVAMGGTRTETGAVPRPAAVPAAVADPGRPR